MQNFLCNRIVVFRVEGLYQGNNDAGRKDFGDREKKTGMAVNPLLTDSYDMLTGEKKELPCA